MTAGSNEKVLIDSRMIEIMRDGSKEGAHFFHRSEVGGNVSLLKETVHCLCHICGMDAVVVGIGVVVSLLEEV